MLAHGYLTRPRLHLRREGIIIDKRGRAERVGKKRKGEGGDIVSMKSGRRWRCRAGGGVGGGRGRWEGGLNEGKREGEETSLVSSARRSWRAAES